MSLQVIDRDQGEAVGEGDTLGHVHPHDERGGQARAVRHGNRRQVGPRYLGVAQCLLDHRNDPPDMLAGRQLGHDTAKALVQHLLGEDDVAQNVATTSDHCSRRLVTRRFQSEQYVHSVVIVALTLPDLGEIAKGDGPSIAAGA